MCGHNGKTATGSDGDGGWREHADPAKRQTSGEFGNPGRNGTQCNKEQHKTLKPISDMSSGIRKAARGSDIGHVCGNLHPSAGTALQTPRTLSAEVGGRFPTGRMCHQLSRETATQDLIGEHC